MQNKNFKLTPHSIVTVIGGAGFIGTYIVDALARFGCRVKIIDKNASYAGKHLKISGFAGQISLIDSDINDDHISSHIQGSDVVINLVGVLTPKSGTSFQDFHIVGAEKIAMICAEHNVNRLIHFSALGADRASQTSEYARTKFTGERAVLKHFPKAVILRPSVVFGQEDKFLNTFAQLMKFLPIMPLFGGGNVRFQPAYVGDIAQATIKAIESSTQKVGGKTFELGGPRQYTLKELFEILESMLNKKVLFIPIPFFIAKLQAKILQLMPTPLLTVDQVELMKYDNILIGNNGLNLLGVTPTPLEPILKTYI